ncbi:hypothetical protein AB6A40_004501 [Gnathostoma spinigerum]|uniref:GW182 middle domain-containing protein n=1 Tax=Gnathostoma spinigerum TaxID=75299 RepID=A0ABD6EM53_9BILA
MWLLSDTPQPTAETASLNSWSVDQQNRWSGELSGGLPYEDPIRAIIPPAFRNSNSKVIWHDSTTPSGSLEANVNEALGISNWPSRITQPGDQEFFSEPSKPWDLGIPPQPSRNTGGPPPFCGSSMQNKAWADDPSLSIGLPRQPVPHPSYMVRNLGGWPQQDPRNSNYLQLQHQGNSPSYDMSGIGGTWPQRGPLPMNGIPPTAVPPPPRSRLHNVWSGNGVQGGQPDICSLQPRPDFSTGIGGNWMPITTMGNSAIPRYPSYMNQYPQPMENAKFTAPQKSNSFMGEDAVWQDPNGETRKWLRDTGTAIWGDPEKQPKEIKHWIVPPGIEYEEQPKKEGASEDSDAVVSPKSSDSTSQSSPVPGSRVIAPTGWGDLPPMPKNLKISACANVHVTNNVSWPSQMNSWDSSVDSQNGVPKTTGSWNILPLSKTDLSTNQWNKQPVPTAPVFSVPPGGNELEMPPATQKIADQLRNAISKGLLDLQMLNGPLDQQTLGLIHTLLDRLPVLDQVEMELKNLRAAVHTNCSDNVALETLMSPEQKTEYDRLVIQKAATQTDIAFITRKIRESSDTTNRPSSAALCASESFPPFLKATNNPVDLMTSSSTPRFGDSILDVTANAAQQKPYYSIF